MANELDVGGIVMRIRADASGVQEGVRQLESAMTQMRTSAEQAGAKVEGAAAKETAAVKGAATATTQAAGQVTQANQQMGQSAQGAAATQAIAYAAIAAAAYKMIDGVVGAVSRSIAAINKYEAALTGLSSVASGKGISSSAMEEGLAQLEDAFFDTASAATALKNLLSRGYSMDQAVESIIRLKDAAAFGRQASLGLAQAVVGATEGLKNENSILVDNAGVTKNVSKMWEDYARSIGVSVTALTTAQKIQAEYNGIMAETKYQQGDLAKLTTTLAGAQAEAAMSGELLARAYGSEMTPVVSVLTGLWNTFLVSVRGIVEAIPGLASGVSASAVGAAVLAGVLPAAVIGLTALKAKFVEAAAGAAIFGVSMSAAMPWLAGIGAVIGIAVGAFTALKKSQEDAAKAAEEAAAKHKEEMKALQDSSDNLKKLEARYTELVNKKRLSYRETKELKSIEIELSSQYGISVNSLGELGGAYDAVTESIKKKIAAQLQELTLAQKDTLTKSEAEYLQAVAIHQSEVALGYDDMARKKAEWEAAVTAGPGNSERDPMGVMYAVAVQGLKDLDATAASYAAHSQAVVDKGKQYVSDLLTVTATTLQASGTTISAAAKTAADAMVQGMLPTDAQGMAALNVQGVVTAYTNALRTGDFSSATDAMAEMEAKFLSGATLTEADQEKYRGAWGTLFDFTTEMVTAFGGSMDDFSTQMMAFAPLVESYGGSIDQLFASWSKTQTDNFMAQSVEDINTQIGVMSEKAATAGQSMQSLADKTNEYKTTLAALTTLQKIEDEGIDKKSEAYIAARQSAEDALGYEITSYADLTSAIYNYTALQNTTTATANQQLRDTVILYTDLKTKRNALALTYGEENTQVKALDEAIALLALDYAALQSAMKNGVRIQVTTDTSGVKEAVPTIEELTAAIDVAGNAMQGLKVKRETITSLQTLVAEAKKTQAAGKDVGTSWRDAISAALGSEFTGTVEDAEDVLAALAAGTDDAMGNVVAKLDAYESQIRAALADAEYKQTINPSVSINTAPLVAALALINWWRRLFGLGDLGKPSGGGGGGGGGGSGNKEYDKELDDLQHRLAMDLITQEQYYNALLALRRKYKDKLKEEPLEDLDEEIHETQERLRQEAYNNAMDRHNHEVAMGNMSTEQQIANLQRILRQYRLNAEERADIEEQIHDLELRLQDERYQAVMADYNHQIAMGQLNADQQIAFLRNILAHYQLTAAQIASINEQIYALQQSQQQAALDAQQDAIKTAYSKIVAALKNRLTQERDAELAAIDRRIKDKQDEQDAINEAERVADYEESLAEKQRQLRTTKSARERRAIQKEIDDLIAAETKRQADLARQAEIEALRDERQSVTDRYADLMSEENLRQEALRLVMSNNLQEMSDLIASYGDAWQDAGASLAEALTSGLLSGSASIITSMQTLTANMNAAVQAAISGAASNPALSRGVSVVINGMTVREEADIGKVASAILSKMEAARR